MSCNLTPSNTLAAKMRSGRAEKYGTVTVMNKDGHFIIKDDIYQLIKKNSFQQIECIMNLPGGAIFFLPSFKGNVIYKVIFLGAKDLTVPPQTKRMK